MTGFDELFGDTGTAGPQPSPKRKPKANPRAPLHVVEDQSEDPRPDPAQARKHAAAQDAEVRAAADAYIALLPAIRAATPQRPTFEETKTLTGGEWVMAQWHDALTTDAAAFGLDSRFWFTTHISDVGGLIVTVTVPEDLAGQSRASIAETMVAEASRRQNLGVYEAHPDPVNKRQFWLIRDNAVDTTAGWREQPKTAAFYRSAVSGGTYHQQVLDLAGLVLKDPKTGQSRYPQREFRTGDRGGECVLTLPPGMLPKHAIAAQDGLRAALSMPELTVDAGDGLRPVIRLNSKPIVKEFPKRNPLEASRLWLPKTEAERYACSAEVRLFLGVTETGEVIAPKLKERSHAAIFGMTNSGKSTAMVTTARSLAAQGCEVWLLDAKGTPEFRSLYKEGVPGITHLSVRTPALMHATVHKFRELYRFRAAVANELADRGLTVDEILWPRVVLIFDEMGEFLNKRLSDGGDKVAKKQAEVTVNILGEIGAEARAYGCHLIVAGQHVYVAALPNKLKEHLSIRAVFGKASDTHIQRLYDEQDRESAKAAREGILPGLKGRGIVLADEGDAVQFQAFHNDPEAAAAFARAAAGTPRLIRWAHRFPVGDDVPGAHGAWQEWGAWEGDSSYEPDGTVEDIGTVPLDRRSSVAGQIVYDPAAAPWDMLSASYSPGSPPRSRAFQNIN